MKLLLKYISWRNWGMITMNPVLENAYIFFFAAISSALTPLDFALRSVLSTALSMAMFSFGYLLNDWFDLARDRNFQTLNVFTATTPAMALTIILAALIIQIPFVIYFYRFHLVIPIYATWLLLAIMYSVPPFYLKGRGLTGLAGVTLALRTLPVALVCAIFELSFDTYVWAILCYVSLRGFGADLSHQIFHYEQDRSCNVHTFAVARGISASQWLLNITFTLERVMLLATAILLTRTIYITSQPAQLLLIICIPMLLIISISIIIATKLSVHTRTLPNPHLPEYGKKDVLYHLHKTYPKMLITLSLLMVLMVQNQIYALALVPLLLYFKCYDYKKFTSFFRLKPTKGLP